MSHRVITVDVNSVGVSSGAAGTKRNVEATTALETIQTHWMGTVTYLTSVWIDANAGVHAPKSVRTAQKRKKSPNSFSVGTQTSRAPENMAIDAREYVSNTPNGADTAIHMYLSEG